MIPSDMHDLAASLFQMFSAYVIAGFTTDQALTLVSNYLSAQSAAISRA